MAWRRRATWALGLLSNAVGESINYYLVLGVEKDASQEEIERAFTRVSTQNYTLLGGMGMGGKQTARIEEAYSVLRDPRRRAAYDRELRQGKP